MEFVAWHDQTGAEHQVKMDQYGAAGFRFISLSIYDVVSNPLYAAVMVKRASVVAQREFHGLTEPQMQTIFNEQTKLGMGPTIICATGTAANPLYAIVFEPAASIPLTKFGVSVTEFTALNAAQFPANILTWAAIYGDPGEELCAGIWHANVAKTPWNADGVGGTQADAQAVFDAQTSAWERLRFITTSRGQRYLTVYSDDSIGGYEAQDNLTSAQYQAAFNTQTGQGLFPLLVQAAGEGSNARFSVIFARQEEIIPRQWMPPTGSPAVPAIDAAMQNIMQTYNVRAASLAVTKGQKLVLARAYTYAEPGYPVTEPLTYFRIASCSKTLTSLAIHRLIQQGKISLGEKMQAILDIKTPSGQTPPDANIAAITVQQLLEMNSGLSPEFSEVGPVAVKEWNAGHPNQPATHLPATEDQIAAYMVTQPTQTPGTAAATYYNNFGYFMLGQILRKKMGTSYFQALSELLLNPLKINTTNNANCGIRVARSLVSAQLPNEARYHSTNLVLARSTMSDDQPLVAQDYGDEALETGAPPGGLSASAAALARVCALFSLKAPVPPGAWTPPIPELTYQVLENVIVASKNSFRGHGFDVVDQVGGAYRVQKGGSLETSQDSLSFTVGEIGFVVCWNTEGVGGDWYPYFPEVVSVAQTHDWGSADLFPNWGMASY